MYANCYLDIQAYLCNFHGHQMDRREGLKTRSVFLLIVAFDILAILAAIVLGVQLGRPKKYFGEHQFITWISCLQLLTISWLAFRTFRMRRSAADSFWRSPALIWALISFGFLYLAADEYFLFHESLDYKIHALLGMKETALTDRIDDMIIGLYGIIGLCTIYLYRQEMRKFSRALPFLICGFALMFLMVAADTATNKPDLLGSFLQHDVLVPVLVWLAVAEDSVKLLAEACFIGGAYTALMVSRRIGRFAAP
jgi:hypothetical protein